MGTLLTKSEVKNDLDIDHGDFDSYIDNLIDEAEADMMSYIGTPITQTTFTEKHDGGKSKLRLGHFPVDESTVTVTDLETPGDSADNETLTQDDDYRVLPERGLIVKITTEGRTGRNIIFAEGSRRWKVEYDAGLELMDTWTAKDKKVLKGSIRKLVVANFEDSNPRTARRQFASGASRRSTIKAIPHSVQEKWDRYAEVVMF